MMSHEKGLNLEMKSHLAALLSITLQEADVTENLHNDFYSKSQN